MSKFDEFWEAYPSKVGKKPCQNWWTKKKLEQDNELADKIINGVIAHKELSERWKNNIIPNPLTFLNQERWNDEFKIAKTEIRPLGPQDKNAPFRKLGFANEEEYLKNIRKKQENEPKKKENYMSWDELKKSRENAGGSFITLKDGEILSWLS